MKWTFRFVVKPKGFKQSLHPLTVTQWNSVPSILSATEPWPQVASILPQDIEIELHCESGSSDLRFICDPSHKCPNKLKINVYLTPDDLAELDNFFGEGITIPKVFELNGEADFADQWTNSIPGIPNQTDFEGGQPAKFHNLHWT